MALKRNETYPGRFSNPTDDHPQGAFKNRSAPGAQDGSYLEQRWANDWDGFFGRLLTLAEISPNGNVDTASSSQYYDALKSLFLQRTNPFGDIKSDGTVQTALENLGLGDIATAGVGTGVLSGAGRITLPLIIGGVKQNLIIQWGNITTTAGSGPITFPLAFPTALLASYACEYDSSIWKPGSDAACAVYGIDTKSRTGMRIASLTYSGGTWVNVNAQCQWFALGY